MKKFPIYLLLLCVLLVGCSSDEQTAYISVNGTVTDVSPYTQVQSKSSSGSFWDSPASDFPELSAHSGDEISIDFYDSFSVDAVKTYGISELNRSLGTYASEYTDLTFQQEETTLSFQLGESMSEYQLIVCSLTRTQLFGSKQESAVFIVKAA